METQPEVRVRIHRGAQEVGGNCVEIEAVDGSRIALDVGLPIGATPGDVAPPRFGGPLSGVLISHPHLDHYGLVDLLDPYVPTYLGAEAASLLDAAAFFSPATRSVRPTGHLHDRAPMAIGSFSITPYLVDHSGFDAYSLLVEADGRRLFYTGDFRGHGRKARLFEELLAHPPRPVDVLIMEGTQVGGVDYGGRTERQLEDALVSTCAATPGLVAAVGSAQNIDRLVTAFRAARRAGRIFVTDLYTATVAAATRPTIPQPGFDGYRVYLPRRQRALVRNAGEFRRLSEIRDIRIFDDELASDPARFLTYLTSSAVPELLHCGALRSDAVALWSMWDGYLQEPAGRRLIAQLAERSVPLRSLHASGHATPADLRRLVTALTPTKLVPIHTDRPEGFVAFSERTVLQPDGRWWTV